MMRRWIYVFLCPSSAAAFYRVHLPSSTSFVHRERLNENFRLRLDKALAGLQPTSNMTFRGTALMRLGYWTEQNAVRASAIAVWFEAEKGMLPYSRDDQ